MKKVLLSLIVVLMTLALAGCKKPTDGESSSNNSNGAAGNGSDANGAGGSGGSGSGGSSGGSSAATPKRTKATGKIGEWEGAYEVGDIVFTDGSATPDSSTLTLTDAQKEAAIAVIFYKGTGLNSYVNHKDDTSKTRTLGMGLLHSEDVGRMSWCLKDDDNDITANGYNWEFSDTESDYYLDDNYIRQFHNDKNGSDNFDQIKKFLKSKNADDTANPDLYPAFYFAINYKDQAGSRVKNTAYETGWYLPSIAEIWRLGEVQETVDAASTLCGGSHFVLSGRDNDEAYLRPYYYWTSTDTLMLGRSDEYYATIYSFLAQGMEGFDKSIECWVLAIREF